MAQKVVLNGKIIGVGPVEMVGEVKPAKKQFIVVEINGELGDEQWLVSIYGDRVDKFKLDASFINKKAVVEGWAKSKYVEQKETGKPLYIINVEMSAFDLVA